MPVATELAYLPLVPWHSEDSKDKYLVMAPDFLCVLSNSRGKRSKLNEGCDQECDQVEY